MKKHKRRVALLCLLLCACLLGGAVLDDMTVSLERVDYYADDLPLLFYGYRILAIADFHDSFYFDQVADIVRGQKPDLVLFLGDMTELNHRGMDDTLRLLEGIRDVAPVYGVLGNHEVWRDDVNETIAQLEAHGLRLLNDEKVTIERDGQAIDLVGVRDVTDQDDALANSWLVARARAFLEETVDPDRFTLLACHRPNLYPYLDGAGADIMLSGHLHGGVVRLPGLGGVFDVAGGLLPKYDKGFYAPGEMDLFVSSGCDFRPPRLRLFNGPSVTLMTLKR